MASCLNGATLGICVTIAACIISGIGVFSDDWWRGDTGDTYSIFTVVNCTNGVCALTTTGTEAWILFGQVSALSGFILLIGSLILQLFYKCCENRPLLYIMVSVLAISCLLSLLHLFVMISMYHKLSEAYIKQMRRPDRNGFLYQTLPVGLVAISGVLCIPAGIAIMVHRIKQSYDYKTDPKNPNRLV